ncbi:MAG: DUF2341 domain-containing protein [Bacteroidia bacterium]|nr:DUF2341 domain-containing protein [Bacteroidia bacterium]
MVKDRYYVDNMTNSLYIFLLVSLLSQGLRPCLTLAQDSLSAWKYHREIVIDNSQSPDSLRDYQISFSLPGRSLIEAGKIHPAGHDLRVFDSDKQTPLCFVPDNPIYHESVTVWVRIPSLAAGHQKKIYCCYGNPEALPVDYSQCTFLMFDDFDGTAIDEVRWEIHGQGGIRVANSQVTFEGEDADILLRSRHSYEMPVMTEMKVDACAGKYLAMA